MLGTELTILTAVAQTTTQTSQTFVVPSRFQRMLISLDLTAGSTLLIDYAIEVFLPGPNAWVPLITELPAADNITGVSRTDRYFGLAATDSAVNDERISIGGQLRVVVTHGNANAATYKVYMQPI